MDHAPSSPLRCRKRVLLDPVAVDVAKRRVRFVEGCQDGVEVARGDVVSGVHGGWSETTATRMLRGRQKGADRGRSVEAGTERRSKSCITAQYCADPVGARGAPRARRGTW
jgi:hypothetical protein